MPSNKNMPSALQRLSARPVIHSESSANGTLSGSVSMMMNGYAKFSNCAAKTMYMKMEASSIASNKFQVVSSSTFTCPVKRYEYPGGNPISLMDSTVCAAPRSNG